MFLTKSYIVVYTTSQANSNSNFLSQLLDPHIS